MQANEIGLPSYEVEVSCGAYCLGGQPKFFLTDMPEYTDARDVWVRGDMVGESINRLRALLRRTQDILRMRNADDARELFLEIDAALADRGNA